MVLEILKFIIFFFLLDSCNMPEFRARSRSTWIQILISSEESQAVLSSVPVCPTFDSTLHKLTLLHELELLFFPSFERSSKPKPQSVLPFEKGAHCKHFIRIFTYPQVFPPGGGWPCTGSWVGFLTHEFISQAWISPRAGDLKFEVSSLQICWSEEPELNFV